MRRFIFVAAAETLATPRPHEAEQIACLIDELISGGVEPRNIAVCEAARVTASLQRRVCTTTKVKGKRERTCRTRTYYSTSVQVAKAG